MAKEIVKRILITEKGSALSAQNRYCLEVDVKASKPEIRQAVRRSTVCTCSPSTPRT